MCLFLFFSLLLLLALAGFCVCVWTNGVEFFGYYNRPEACLRVKDLQFFVLLRVPSRRLYILKEMWLVVQSCRVKNTGIFPQTDVNQCHRQVFLQIGLHYELNL